MKPYIFNETDNFAVVYKPPRLHCAPLKNSGGFTLLDWYAAIFPDVTELSGRKIGEGGLLHRLDFETQGLVLFAKNQKSLDSLYAQQEEGLFVKEYSALCHKNPSLETRLNAALASGAIESYFRPFGPGRKQVRPIMAETGKEIAKDKNGYYRTEIACVSETGAGYLSFSLRLRRGFRHQIRSHLAWIGCPVINDPLYGAVDNASDDGFLALRANGLAFADPENGLKFEYRIEPLRSFPVASFFP